MRVQISGQLLLKDDSFCKVIHKYQALLHVKVIRSYVACGSLHSSAIFFSYSVETVVSLLWSQFYALNYICSLIVDPYLNDKLERRVLDFVVLPSDMDVRLCKHLNKLHCSWKILWAALYMRKATLKTFRIILWVHACLQRLATK